MSGNRFKFFFLSGVFAFLAAQGLSSAAYGTSATSPLAGKDIQRMTYAVYAGGINAVKAELDIMLESEDRYTLALEAETRGFLGRLVPWSGRFETHGWLLENGVQQPELHKSTAVWRGEHDTKKYKYGKDGRFIEYIEIEDSKDITPETVDPELVEGTTDVLTATLAVMKEIATKGQCEGRSEIFDGRRRFALVFNHEAEEVLTASRRNIYEGEAVRCSVEVQPIAGRWRERPRGWMSIQEQGREQGTLPTVWLANLADNGPAVPVRVRVKTDYGTLFMHLADYRNGDSE